MGREVGPASLFAVLRGRRRDDRLPVEGGDVWCPEGSRSGDPDRAGVPYFVNLKGVQGFIVLGNLAKVRAPGGVEWWLRLSYWPAQAPAAQPS